MIWIAIKGLWESLRMLSRLSPGARNDYAVIQARRPKGKGPQTLRASVVIPVYNRREALARTLAGLEGQDYPRSLQEILVVDDGSADAPEEIVASFRGRLPIQILRQKDLGFRLAAARNMGIRAASGDIIVSLDCDMLPEPGWLSAHMRWHNAAPGSLCVLGRNEFIDGTFLTVSLIRQDFESVRRAPRVAIRRPGGTGSSTRSDWRLAILARTGNLRHHEQPYLLASGGNVSFGRKEALEAGLFDEAFSSWGGEDDEFAYRLYRRGTYFVPEPEGLAYHQDHPVNAQQEADRAITRCLLSERIPGCRPAGLSRREDTPRISVCITTFNAAHTIKNTVDTALGQSIPDIEVCIVDHGSAPDTTRALDRYYGDHPRVRWSLRPTGCVGVAARAAVDMGRGEFVLMIDAQDELAETAAAVLLSLMRDYSVALAYGGLEEITPIDGVSVEGFPRKGPNARRNTHPRMFRSRDYYRCGGFDETSAVLWDDSIWLKLAQAGRVAKSRTTLFRRRPPNCS